MGGRDGRYYTPLSPLRDVESGDDVVVDMRIGVVILVVGVVDDL